MKKFWNQLLDYFRGPQGPLQEQIRLQNSIIDGLEVSVALLNTHRAAEKTDFIKVVAAIVLQHGGEFTLDSGCLEMVNDKAILHFNRNEDGGIFYQVTFEEDTQKKELPNGYDLTDDEEHCSDCGQLPDEVCGNSCNACEGRNHN